MSDDDRPKTARRGWRKRLRWLSIGVLLLLLLASGPVCKFLYDRHKAQVELQAVIRDLDEHDPGWRLEEIEAALLELPDDQNGALVVSAAITQLPDKWIDEDVARELDKLEPPDDLTEEQRASLEPALRGAEPALVEARKLVKFPRGRHTLHWTPDVIGTSFQSVDDTRTVAKLLALDALLRAHEGDMDLAWLSGQASLNAGRSIGDPPMLVPLLVRLELCRITVKSMERTLAKGQVSEANLAATQHLLEDEAAQPLLLVGLRGEMAAMNRLFVNLETGAVPLGSLSLWDDTKESFAQTYMYPQGHAYYLRHMVQIIDAMKLPPQEQERELARLESATRTAPTLARLLSPACKKVTARFHQTRAKTLCSSTALAMERYRMKENHWPKQLADLVPEYLAQVPADPFDGKPLRFRQSVDHVVIYSVGPDAVDDEGNVSNDDRSAPGTDIGFRLWNPDKRRRPAK